MGDFSNIYPVILSGGTGTRLWPLSRAQHPKQLLPLIGNDTMLQATCLRVGRDAGFNSPLIIANDDHRFIVAEQLHEKGINWDSIILEPMGRNTAPAATIAALKIQAKNPDGLMLLLPSDHAIQDASEFQQKLLQAKEVAQKGHLVTFGIKPTSPETGYGYIKQGQKLPETAECFHVEKFIEKPDLPKAKHLVSTGEFSWNSGMFLMPVSTYLDEVFTHEPNIFSAANIALVNAKVDLDFLRLDKEAFAQSPAKSIDYAVMEKTDKAVVILSDFGWNDVGAWKALWDLSPRDAQSNTCIGDNELIDVSNCYIRSEDGQLITAIGVDNLTIVSTEDALLVANSDRAVEVKDLVEKLIEKNREEATYHAQVYRPWGNYHDIDKKERFRLKRIVVKPGGILSLQKHKHRSEHWVVVKGVAEITCGDRTFTLQENESTFIPKETAHRLKNVGDTPLHLIEVQVGDYVGEDDIERLEDNYGRD